MPYGIDVPERRATIARDRIDLARERFRDDPDPSFATYGPRSRADFLRLLRRAGPV